MFQIIEKEITLLLCGVYETNLILSINTANTFAESFQTLGTDLSVSIPRLVKV